MLLETRKIVSFFMQTYKNIKFVESFFDKYLNEIISLLMHI